ncbi:hypothetical protein [Mucilaginibacter sp.]
MKVKILFVALLLMPILSQAQSKIIPGTGIVTLKTFTTLLSDEVKAEKVDDYFKPLGYKFTGMEDILRHGMQGHQLTYTGDHSFFKLDLVNRLKLTLLYETKVEHEYNYLITDAQTSDGYKMTDHADNGLVSSITFANNYYVIVFMSMKMQNGMHYSIKVSNKENNIVVNDGNNQ